LKNIIKQSHGFNSRVAGYHITWATAAPNMHALSLLLRDKQCNSAQASTCGVYQHSDLCNCDQTVQTWGQFCTLFLIPFKDIILVNVLVTKHVKTSKNK